MLYVLGFIGAVIGLAVSIGAHELGHMVPARRYGIRVPEFFIGFGPRLWSTRRGETEYGLKAIPMGGYVRLIGMYPPPQHRDPRDAARHGRLEQLAEEARVEAWKEVGPGDEERVFYRLTPGRKLVVMASGTLMNLLLATLLFTVLLVGIGLPFLGTRLATVSPCVPTYMATPEAAAAAWSDPPSLPEDPCGAQAVASPASRAGLVPGDVITTVDGEPAAVWSDLTTTTRQGAGEVVVLGVRSADGQERTIEVELATAYRPALDEDGLTTDVMEETGYLGVGPAVEYRSEPLSAVPALMWDVTTRSVQVLVTLPVRVYHLASDLVTGAERDLESPISVVGVGRISGEVASSDDSLIGKVAIFVALMASLNLFLFLFNLVPLLPLDGGHAAGAVWEAARRRIASARGRPDPGPVDTARALPVAYAVAALFVVMGGVVIVADVVNPISLYG